MKLKDLNILDDRKNIVRARNIAKSLKARAKRFNPSDELTPSGWRADPHQGSMGAAMNWR